MKNLINLLVTAILLVSSAYPLRAIAQQKEDIIFLADGEQKKGKVLSIDEQSIKFSYTGEDVQYELKKASVAKIVFANGREEMFTKESQGNTAPAISSRSASSSTGNLLAVLPFEIASNDAGLATDIMRREVQQACADAIKAQAKSINVQDPRNTNAALSKAGIGLHDIANHTPDDLAAMLGVDYVVLGVYDIENKGTSTYGSGVASYDSKQKGDKQKGTAVQSNNSFTQINYDSKVQMAVYNNLGEQLFSDTRRPFIGSVDSYKGALKTLAKRMPLK
ncbi:hypothetical protein [Sphingobacterium deserti]|uniref:Uncharacterized protein n=1 Tax=Sphingobacterium deserti TaxID=1229276 RepID=A0A0B8T5E7_9SPHI|nr:hypothetical protein [Sphingobacterium deserti]KGE12814.1 hypothetical protein DI53_3408 [Sphingobacterium deserti]